MSDKPWLRRNTRNCPSAIDRFWEKVECKKKDDCWEWQANQASGYGKFFDKGHGYLAHRYSWIIHFGKIPNGMYVLHKCDNKLCVNPNHLFLGTSQDNTQDMIRKNRHNYLKGSELPQAKLNEKDVMKIRQLYNSGIYNQPQLAEKYNVDQSMISYIVNRKYWKHI